MIFARVVQRALKCAVMASALAFSTVTTVAPAHAQLWDWGGGSTVGGSGATTVRFSSQYTRGQLVVSVGDRRLDDVTGPTMIKENPRLPTWVPGGHPMNPLGVRALYLGSSAYRIHGTDAPWTIGQPVSKGCIRMYNKDVVELYNRVPVGTRVTITYQRFTSSS